MRTLLPFALWAALLAGCGDSGGRSAHHGDANVVRTGAWQGHVYAGGHPIKWTWIPEAQKLHHDSWRARAGSDPPKVVIWYTYRDTDALVLAGDHRNAGHQVVTPPHHDGGACLTCRAAFVWVGPKCTSPHLQHWVAHAVYGDVHHTSLQSTLTAPPLIDWWAIDTDDRAVSYPLALAR